LHDVTPGSGETIIAPVSVCHQVSTMGQRSPPMTRRYHIHASGLIGSPTLPSTLSLERSRPAGSSSPHFMNVRIAVGAVYRIVTPYVSTMRTSGRGRRRRRPLVHDLRGAVGSGP
jgi:hypothetical protein